MTPWSVEYVRALARWETEWEPADRQVTAFLEWVLAAMDYGPPDNCLPEPLEEDTYLCLSNAMGVWIRLVALGYERRMVIIDITPTGR